MDAIFKNNTIMGIVAMATLVLVGLMFWRVKDANANCKSAIEGGAKIDAE